MNAVDLEIYVFLNISVIFFHVNFFHGLEYP